jgi:predicted AlkP superfamily phosphohydrolase/phosphomutase
MRPHRRSCWGLFALFLAVCLALGGCGSERGRVLLVGIDGATLRIAGPMLAEGRLPHLASLAREGVSGPLRSAIPISSPRIWNTIVTGKTPEKHGITDFARKDAEGQQHLFLSSDRRAHALWNIASDAGLSVGVVNFWNTYPPERVNGVMVSDHLLAKQVEGRRKLTKAAATPEGPVIFPEAWHERLRGVLEARDPLTSVANPFRALEGFPASVQMGGKTLSRRYEEDQTMLRIALEIERAIRPDVSLVLLTGIDRVSHALWAAVDESYPYPEALTPSPAEREVAADALRAYYAYTDALVGLLLAHYGPDDLVLVLSDHGFEAGSGFGLLTGVHKTKQALDGVIFARGPGIEPGTLAQGVRVRDVTPTILAWMGLPLGEDMDGRPASFLRVPETRTVATHDTTPVERLGSSPSGVENEIIEQLRELGYVE